MSDDDQIGYLRTRREALALLGSTGLLLAGCRSADGSVRPPSSIADGCVVRPEQTAVTPQGEGYQGVFDVSLQAD